MRTHRYTMGQRVNFGQDYAPDPSRPDDVWEGGYEIVQLLPASNREPPYRIRSVANYDRVVSEHQIQADVG